MERKIPKITFAFMSSLMFALAFANAFSFPDAYLDCKDGFFQDGENCSPSPSYELVNIKTSPFATPEDIFQINITLKSNAENTILFDDISARVCYDVEDIGYFDGNKTFHFRGYSNLCDNGELQIYSSIMNSNLTIGEGINFAEAFKKETSKNLNELEVTESLYGDEIIFNNTDISASSRTFFLYPSETKTITFNYILPKKEFLDDKESISYQLFFAGIPQSYFKVQIDYNEYYNASIMLDSLAPILSTQCYGDLFIDTENPYSCESIIGEPIEIIFSEEQNAFNSPTKDNISDEALNKKVRELENRVGFLEKMLSWFISIFNPSEEFLEENINESGIIPEDFYEVSSCLHELAREKCLQENMILDKTEISPLYEESNFYCENNEFYYSEEDITNCQNEM